MAYRIFFSNSSKDNKIATEIVSLINNAFQGDIEFYHFCRDNLPGREWKKTIQEKLRDFDAVMCLITENHINNPWLYVEWGSFWVFEKRTYLLITDEIKLANLFDPLQDVQIMKLEMIDEVRKLFESLGMDSDRKTIPYGSVPNSILKVGEAIKSQRLENSIERYDHYKADPSKIPDDDQVKKEIAEHFHSIDDIPAYINVVNAIRNDSVKEQLASGNIIKGDAKSAIQIAGTLRCSDRLENLLRLLIDYGYENSLGFASLIEKLALLNQGELRRLTIHILDKPGFSSIFINSILDEFTNMAEFKKVGMHLLDPHHINHCYFDKIFHTVLSRNEKEAAKIMSELLKIDKDKYIEYCKKFTNLEVIGKLETNLLNS